MKLTNKSIKKIKNKKVNKTDQNMIDLSKKICKIIHQSNKEFIEKWLKCQLEKNFKKLIENIVVLEIKKEVNPLIIKKIENAEKQICLKLYNQIKEDLNKYKDELISKIEETPIF